MLVRNAVLIYPLIFLSGAAALVCEVSWSRQVGQVVGHTAQSAALVLAAFFTGTGVGQFLGGRLVARVNPLLGYGLAELAVACGAGSVPSLLTVASATPLGEWAAAALCFAALLPATVPLGATLPFVAEHIAQRERTGGRITLAYALNTAGGLVGIAAATAFLLVAGGVAASGYFAAAASAGCGLLACIVSLDQQPVKAPVGHGAAGRPPVRFWLVGAASGFGILGLEVLYARLFALVFHNSTYTFGAVVAVFLAGLSLGAVLVGAVERRLRPDTVLAAGCALGAVSVAASVIVFVRLTGLEYFAAGDTFAGYLTGAVTLVAAVALVPAVLLGTTLPTLLATKDVGRSVGRLVAVNTAGAAAGAVVVGFLLLPWLGLWATLALHVALFGATGVALLLRDARRKTALSLAVAVTLGVVVVGSGPLRPSGTEEIVHRWETAYGWIDVTRSRADGARRVRQNLHYRHGSTASASREYRQGLLPLLLHPRPTDVAFLGLGTGLTAAPLVADRGVERAVVVELIPEVVEAARLLSDANLGVVDHPRVEVRTGDARHYMQRTARQFDVVVADLFVPWESRAGYLYTVEFYQTVRGRLKPGGHFCQWLALYQFGPAEFELVADSFAAVFPNVTLWWGQLDNRFPILALVGSDAPLEPDASRWDALASWPGVAGAGLGTSSDYHSWFGGRWPAPSGQNLNTDEHPWLEFAAPLSRGDDRCLSGAALRTYFDTVLAALPDSGVRFGPCGGRGAARRRAALRTSLFGGTPG